ncbi:MAG: hypothetical protein ABI724_13525 [Betaproteobacteria bacterium]
MATSIRRFNPASGSPRRPHLPQRWPIAAVALAVAAALNAAPAAAGQFGSVYVMTRADGRGLTIYEKDGRHWIEGTPGQEYSIRVCNTTGARVLAVTSVDGVNVVSGETASPAQSGYVLNAYQCTDINGWRKNLASINAFYFTELPDSYAARTGRPDNVGVIGVAFFRERPQPIAWKDAPAKLAASPAAEPSARQEAAGGNAAAEGRVDAMRKSLANSADSAGAASMPAPAAKIGTGYGRNESSHVQTTRFERESATPNETIAFNYDRRENLIAMGILPPPSIARSSNPFPAWTPRFVPVPPPR